jgi:hypothetical protein
MVSRLFRHDPLVGIGVHASPVPERFPHCEKSTPIRLRQAGSRLKFDDRLEGCVCGSIVHKFPMNSHSRVSALGRLIDAGEVDPSEIVALSGKTEGNGGASDFTRGFASPGPDCRSARNWPPAFAPTSPCSISQATSLAPPRRRRSRHGGLN